MKSLLVLLAIVLLVSGCCRLPEGKGTFTTTTTLTAEQIIGDIESDAVRLNDSGPLIGT